MNFGEFAKELHQKVGEDSKYIVETARTLGMEDIHYCSNYEEALEILHNVLKQNDAVLIKGSRGMKLERLVEALRREFI